MCLFLDRVKVLPETPVLGLFLLSFRLDTAQVPTWLCIFPTLLLRSASTVQPNARPIVVVQNGRRWVGVSLFSSLPQSFLVCPLSLFIVRFPPVDLRPFFPCFCNAPSCLVLRVSPSPFKANLGNLRALVDFCPIDVELSSLLRSVPPPSVFFPLFSRGPRPFSIVIVSLSVGKMRGPSRQSSALAPSAERLSCRSPPLRFLVSPRPVFSDAGFSNRLLQMPLDDGCTALGMAAAKNACADVAAEKCDLPRRDQRHKPGGADFRWSGSCDRKPTRARGRGCRPMPPAAPPSPPPPLSLAPLWAVRSAPATACARPARGHRDLGVAARRACRLHTRPPHIRSLCEVSLCANPGASRSLVASLFAPPPPPLALAVACVPSHRAISPARPAPSAPTPTPG